MYSVVKIGEQAVPMLAMASVDVFYKHIFREDPVKIQASADFDSATAIDLFTKMAFVMAKYAELKATSEMKKLNEDAFIDWLCQFDRSELYTALPDIRNVYEGQKVGSSSAKNA